MYLLVIPPTTRIVTVWDTSRLVEPSPRHPGKRWLYAGVKRNLLRRPDVYVAISETIRGNLHRLLGIPLDRILVARPGVDEHHFTPRKGPRPSELPDDGKTTILHVGLAYKRKGIDLLVEALGRLGAHRFRLIRVGPERDPAYAQAYRTRAAELGLDLVECGLVPDEALPAYYGHADLFVFPSLDEGAGIPPLEAMACGTNVVVSDIPAHREMCGDLAFYSPTEPVRLASAIAGALENRRPPDALRQHALRFTWARTADTYLKVYSELGVPVPALVGET